jgi:hypothetical protein
MCRPLDEFHYHVQETEKCDESKYHRGQFRVTSFSAASTQGQIQRFLKTPIDSSFQSYDFMSDFQEGREKHTAYDRASYERA